MRAHYTVYIIFNFHNSRSWYFSNEETELKGIKSLDLITHSIKEQS